MLRFLVLAAIFAATVGAASPHQAVRGTSQIRPRIVENGTDVVLFPPFPVDVW